MENSPTVVVLTALELEHAAVRRLLRQCHRVDHPSGTVFEVGLPPQGRNRVVLAVAGEGNVAAAVIAERAIAAFRPRALMFVGVAGALRDDLALGDVVVATKVYAYHGGSVQEDGFRARPRSWQIPHDLDQLARHVSRTDGWVAALGQEARHPVVHFRPIAAGEVVLNARHGTLSDQLRHHYADAVAIEMESAGVAQAAHLNSALPVLTVRGISDRADGGKRAADDEGWQPVAAAAAAAFALAVVAELGPTAATPTPPGSAAEVPRQLPGRAGPLIGRSTDLARLDELLLDAAGDRSRIAVLTGMAGAGKTAVALDWAHTAADAFPGGLLFADLRGFGPDPPRDPREILAEFLRALGLSRAAERGSLDERASRFRTAVSGRRVLVVLDNARSVDQVRPLLPSTEQCAVLITSRESLRGLRVRHSATIVAVDRLSRAESGALLAAEIGARADADPHAVDRLAERCAGLPLALRIAAEMVVARPGDELDVLAAELDQGTALGILDTGDDPYSAVRTVFSWSYAALDDREATAFRRLGLHPGNSLSLPIAAALLDLPAASARTILRRLVGAHLVVEAAADRYEVHDLLREFAIELGERLDDSPMRSRTQRRMADRYLYIADRAGRAIMPHRFRVPIDEGEPGPDFADRATALRWFDDERTNIAEVFRLESTDLDSQRWRLAYVLRDYFYLAKHIDGWLESHTLAVAACRRLGDQRAEGMTRNNLGRALLEAGRIDAAEQQYTLAGEMLTEAGDQQGATDSRVNIASILRRRGDYEGALRHQYEALAFYRRSDVPRKVGITLRSIAKGELALDRLAAATAHAEEALARFVDLDLQLDAAQTLTTLAGIHRRAGAAEAAEAAASRAAELSTRAGSDFELACALHLLGTVAGDAGRAELARKRWVEAETIFRRLGSTTADSVAADLRGLDGSGSASRITPVSRSMPPRRPGDRSPSSAPEDGG